MLRLLVGALLAVGLLGTTMMASSAQGLPGVPPGLPNGNLVKVPTPLEACLAVFPNGIIVGDPVVGTVDCSDVFGSLPPTEEPTEEPTEVPTEEPTYEPTEEPTYEPTEEPIYEPTKKPAYDHDHDYDHHHDYDHDKTYDHDTTYDHESKDVGGKTAPKVTTMPSTGHAAESGSNAPAATILAAMALVLAMVSGIALRLTGVRIPRR